MSFLLPHIEKYIEDNIRSIDPLLDSIIQYNDTHLNGSRMLSGITQGRFLSFMSQLKEPKLILEIGTYLGFSSLALACGLKLPEGMLHTIEIQEAHATIAQRYFDQSTYKKHIKLHRGDALNIIPTLNCSWDLIFIDANKRGYLEYYQLLLPQLNKAGLIIVDNVLFRGEVCEPPHRIGKYARAIHEFNEFVKNDERVVHSLVPIRDGLMLIIKK